MLAVVLLYSQCIIQPYFLVVKLFLVHMRKLMTPVFHSGFPGLVSTLRQGSEPRLKGLSQSCPQDSQAPRAPCDYGQCTPGGDSGVLQLPLPPAPILETLSPAAQSPAPSLHHAAPSGGLSWGAVCALTTSICCLPLLPPAPHPSPVLHAEPEPAQPHSVRAGQ